MDNALNIRLTEQIKLLTSQDLVRLRQFVDELIRRKNQQSLTFTEESASSTLFLSGLRSLGIPGQKMPFDRAMIYDDLTI